MTDRRTAAFGALLLVDFLITAVMLVTDKNLQTDFGTVSPYYLHWYGALAMGVLDLLGGAVLIALAFAKSGVDRFSRAGRGLRIGALVWTILAILATVGIVATYQQVGFGTAMQFAQYLFGVTAPQGFSGYIPGLYDALAVGYVITAFAGAFALRGIRTPAPSSTSSGAMA